MMASLGCHAAAGYELHLAPAAGEGLYTPALAGSSGMNWYSGSTRCLLIVAMIPR